MLKSGLSDSRFLILWVLAALVFCVPEIGFTGAFGDLEIREEYANGAGNPVGVVEQMTGTAFIRHKNDDFGYRCAMELPIFGGDILITGEEGKLTVKLADESRLTLSSDSKIVINRALYDPDAGERQGFFSGLMGKTRFLIKKMTGSKKSDVKVKTKTAVLGVRGSDFVVEASGESTEITTFEKTTLDVASVNEPEIMITLHSFERVQVDVEGVISEVERLIREDINRIRREFIISARPADVSIPKLDRNIIVPEETLVDPNRISISDPAALVVRPPVARQDIQPAQISAPEMNRVLETHREGVLPERSFDWPNKPSRD